MNTVIIMWPHGQICKINDGFVDMGIVKKKQGNTVCIIKKFYEMKYKNSKLCKWFRP